jgi:hypothetical protein
LGPAIPRVSVGKPSGRIGLINNARRVTDVAVGDLASYKYALGATVGSYYKAPAIPYGLERPIVQAVGVYPIIGKIPPGKIFGGVHIVFGDFDNDFRSNWDSENPAAWSTWLKGLEEALYFDWEELTKMSKRGAPIIQNAPIRRQIDYEGDIADYDPVKGSAVGWVIDIHWIDPSVSKDTILLTLKAKTLYSHSVKR